MRILSHLSANEVKLKPMPFKRELSMEAYLVENEDILALDDGVFSVVNIIREELTLKEGRQSQATDGRIDLLITYSNEYAGIVELKLGTLKEIHLTQIEDYLKTNNLDKLLDDEIGDKQFIPPNWIGVLVGDSICPKLAEKISNGYTTDKKFPIAALTIRRYRGDDGSIYVTTDVIFKNTKSRDKTKYEFDGKILGKGKLVLEVVRKYVEDHPDIDFPKLMKRFPKKMQGSSGVFSTKEEAFDLKNKGQRHFTKPDELIALSDSTIAVSSQWGKDNLGPILEIAKKLNYKIKKSK